jgi:hypothetical protein
MAVDSLSQATWGFRTDRVYKDVSWTYLYVLSMVASVAIGAFTVTNGCGANSALRGRWLLAARAAGFSPAVWKAGHAAETRDCVWWCARVRRGAGIVMEHDVHSNQERSA